MCSNKVWTHVDLWQFVFEYALGRQITCVKSRKWCCPLMLGIYAHASVCFLLIKQNTSNLSFSNVANFKNIDFTFVQYVKCQQRLFLQLQKNCTLP